MPHEEISTWFILTLSAEQAALDHDFEHLDALLSRREQLLSQWDQFGVKIAEKDMAQLKSAEERLNTAMRRVRDGFGQDLRVLEQRRFAGTGIPRQIQLLRLRPDRFHSLRNVLQHSYLRLFR